MSQSRAARTSHDSEHSWFTAESGIDGDRWISGGNAMRGADHHPSAPSPLRLSKSPYSSYHSRLTGTCSHLTDLDTDGSDSQQLRAGVSDWSIRSTRTRFSASPPAVVNIPPQPLGEQLLGEQPLVQRTWFSVKWQWRRKLRTPGTHRPRVLRFLALWTTGMTALAWVFALSSPCPLTLAATDDTCDHWTALAVYYVQTFNFSLAYLLMMYLYGRKAIIVLRLVRAARRQHQIPGVNYRGAPPSGGKSLAANHWTGAASRDVFMQTADSLTDLQRLILPFISIILLTNALAKGIPTALGKPPASAGAQEDGCEAGFNLCKVAWYGDIMLLDVNVVLTVYLVTIFVIMPDLLWSPVTSRAIRFAGYRHLGRLRYLQSILVLPILLNFCVIAKYAVVREKNFQSELLVFCGNLTVVLYDIAALSWIYAPVIRRGRLSPLPKAVPATHQPDETTTEEGRKGAAPPGWMSAFLRRISTSLRRRFVILEAGVRSQREIWCVVIAALFTGRENFEYHTGSIHVVPSVVFWALRTVAVVMVFSIRDEQADFLLLEGTGEAFGLVIDADDLFHAVSHVLEFSQPWPSPIRLYKASLQRAREAMSISYRWQRDCTVLAANGMNINMSMWQLQILIDALAQSSCKYVWMDKFSVPQVPGQLQTTLLARMLAVYASSGCTLVLRSIELPGERYHQRGWTVQEFCACNKMAIATEPHPSVSSMSAVSRVRVSRFRMSIGIFPDHQEPEEDRFWALRKWHLGRLHLCRPFWLYSDIFVDAADALEMFTDLRGRVNTRFEEDKLRALLPLLMNTPVETQAELVRMIRRIEQLTGANMQEELGYFVSTLSMGSAFGGVQPMTASASGSDEEDLAE